MPRLERSLTALGVLLLVGVSTALHGWPTTTRDTATLTLVAAAGLTLVWWRTWPRAVSVASPGLFLAAASLHGWVPDAAVVLYSVSFAVLALAWSGRAAWLVALGAAAYLAVFVPVAGEGDWVSTLMFSVPPYLAGTAFRLRRETADQLALRARELEEERGLFAEIAVRHERARIAAELHDVVGHAVSVMVIQAAAGQRLVDADPGRARAAFTAISGSARQGADDLERLVELLGGDEVDSGVADLTLVDEVVAQSASSGLDVTCRFEGDRERVGPAVAHLAARVVQEGLTNALRHAPGAAVRVALRADDDGALVVSVENDAGTRDESAFVGTGRGLVGLDERVQALGGTFAAGPDGEGGWSIEARLPPHA